MSEAHPDGSTEDRLLAVPAREVDKDRLLAWYRQMALIRRVEEQAAKAYTLRKIKGFCHLYIGQEAVAVGACAALEDRDTVVTSYRDHALARGVEPRPLMAELFGKATGMAHGIGGSMHMASREHNLFGGYGIVGAHIPLAAGAAFASKYRGDGGVALCFFGDGAAQQGAFYEALELAQLWRLPAVFLCENNFYAMGTSLERQSYLTDMSRRGDGVGMVRKQFHGFDVVEVYENVAAAVAHAREGHGPVILEAITYRYRGHSMSDPAKYRAAGELEEKKKQDCLKLAEERLRAFDISRETFDAIKAEVNDIATDAYEFADSSPEPDPAHLYDYTYAP